MKNVAQKGKAEIRINYKMRRKDNIAIALHFILNQYNYSFNHDSNKSKQYQKLERTVDRTVGRGFM